MADANNERVGRALTLLSQSLSPFVERKCVQALGAGWELANKSNGADSRAPQELSLFADREEAPDIAWEPPNEASGANSKADVRFLLRVMAEEWSTVFGQVIGGPRNRQLIKDLRFVSDRFASQETFTSDQTERACQNAEELLRIVAEADLLSRMVAVGCRDDLSISVVRDAFPEFATTEGRSLYFAAVDSARRRLQLLELAGVLRSMVLCEAAFPIPGGSVSAVKWVFRDITSHDRELANQLAGWIVDNRGGNDWIPWGTTSHARSFAEYEQARNEHDARIRRRRAEEREQVRKRRQEAEERGLEHNRRSEAKRHARPARIAEILDMTEHECVSGVIAAEETADYWPQSVAEKCRRGLAESSRNDLQLLLLKARGARTDCWRALRIPIRAELAERPSSSPPGGR